ncbi:branched-chain amino acid ABC transporter permease/ATP-binding protein [Pseudonocardia dioxanivorans]|uniref:branched-chain amino acid ABC transporter permease/ATP-binding protein n=1 Tax=Pseudonocardia dioxanivorans TaxID=240495 RepID=UPI000CD26CD3|nr:branched-chain amino acid ABC transporter permease/ATP-binding protein [Pseudonocardia dioxanivorans]
MDILRFAILGLGTGAIYAVLAQGLVLVYRGSGLLNFAQGAMAMVGAYLYYELVVEAGLPTLVGLLGAVAGCAVLGLILQAGVLRPMRRSSPLTRVIATLGILLILQSLAFLIFGHDPRPVPSLFAGTSVELGSADLVIGVDTLWIIGIGIVLTVGLTLVYRRTSFGRLTTAVAENQLATAALGHSPNRIASANWAIGSALGGLAGVLIAPIIYLEPTSLVLLVVPAMAAALVGQFTSFPLTLVAALLIGVSQSEIQRFVPIGGVSTALPFLVVIGLLIARGRAIPLRNFINDRMPSVGSGRIRPVTVAVLAAVMIVLLLVVDDGWVAALTVTMSYGVIALSVVVITGFAGQLSLAQAVLAGLGAIVAARLVQVLPFPVALVVAALAVGVVGGLVGIPALRTRGVTLAVVTLGLGGALADLLLRNPDFTGGLAGILVPTPSVFGLSLDPFAHAGRYAIVVLLVLVVLGLALANLRRGSTGRRMLAVRANERAAAAVGVDNALLKSYAFVLGAAIAAVGGVLLTFMNASVAIGEAGQFDVLACIVIVAFVVTGGVGYIGGALIGALMMNGGVVSHALEGVPDISDYLPLIGGVVLLVNLMFSPDGLFEVNRNALAKVLPWLRDRPAPARTGLGSEARDVVEVEPATLSVEDVAVSFGGVKAVRGVSLEVRPGEVHGLIGPNGSGKTTIIDAVTGFVRAQQGRILLGGKDVTGWRARMRARAGISRSFQSLELFDGLTVRENLAVAAERPGPLRLVTDLVAPGHVRLNAASMEAVAQFELGDVLDELPDSLSLGQRKAVAIARAVAAAPSVLLLDEPAAGLDEHEADELATLIQALAHRWGIAVLLVEHKIDIVMRICDRVTVLQSGRVLTAGPPDEVRTDPVVMDAYLGAAPLLRGGV